MAPKRDNEKFVYLTGLHGAHGVIRLPGFILRAEVYVREFWKAQWIKVSKSQVVNQVDPLWKLALVEIWHKISRNKYLVMRIEDHPVILVRLSDHNDSNDSKSVEVKITLIARLISAHPTTPFKESESQTKWLPHASINELLPEAQTRSLGHNQCKRNNKMTWRKYNKISFLDHTVQFNLLLMVSGLPFVTTVNGKYFHGKILIYYTLRTWVKLLYQGTHGC